MFSSNTTQVSDGGYQISRSLRFNSADSAYLNRTPASAGNKQTWTLSVWVKRGSLSAFNPIFTAGPVSPRALVLLQSDNKLQVRQVDSTDTEVIKLVTTQVFRDPSAWYHIVVAQDTTQVTSSNRVKVYVNGTQVTAFDTATYPNQNISNLAINDALEHNYGRYVNSPSDGYLSAYLTETNFIDGQALTPSSFGETNAQTGVWQPKAYSGSYGTNGFYLNFSDNSNTTAATLGKDYSGNGNNWTPNNFSVTAGAGNDSLVDSPTSYGTDTGVGGTVRGNYCTLNPLTTTAGTYSQGNLRYLGNSASDRRSNGTISVSTGKWYWEVTLANAPATPRSSLSQYNAFGFGVSTSFNSTTSSNTVTDALVLEDSGYYKNFSGAQTDSGTAFLSGDVLSVAVDLDANTFTFRVNNTSLVTGTIGGTVGRELAPIIISYDGLRGIMDCNFGQRPFAYTAPSGFKALCTQNLPTPTIGATTATLANTFFAPALYTGNDGTQTVTTGIDMATSGALVWIKNRSANVGSILVDPVRGYTKNLESNSTRAEDTFSFITATSSTGFTMNTGSSAVNGGVAAGGPFAYVAWNWKANGAGTTNTAGSITSTVSANTTSGFSVVTYTGTGANATVGHGLGSIPKMMIVKRRSTADTWRVYQATIGNTRFLNLNETAAAGTASTVWNNTTPTSSVFSIGTDSAVNASTSTYVAYCFADVEGYSKFGSYDGNASADGPFVYCGFRPRYVMIKTTQNAFPWIVVDTARNTYNVMNAYLEPNTSDAEATNFAQSSIIDVTANGFKTRTSDDYTNVNGSSFIFAAFAEFPFKYSLARQDSICTHF